MARSGGWPDLPAVGQPSTDRPASQRQRRRGECQRIGGVERGGQPVEEVVVVAEQVCLPGEDRDDVALGELGELREQFVTDAIAQEALVAVAAVVDHGEAEHRAHVFGVGAPQRQQRAARTGSHRRQSAGRAAQQVQEHRLGLVVGGVSGEHVGGQRAVAGGASASLEVRAIAHVEANGAQWDPQRLAGEGGHLGVGRRLGAEPVIDVHRGDGAAGGDRQSDQRGRVGTTAECARDRSACGRERASQQHGSELFGRRVNERLAVGHVLISRRDAGACWGTAGR